MVKFCEQCGTELTEGVLFCKKCGTPVYGQTMNGKGAAYIQPESEKRKKGGRKAAIISLIAVAMILVLVGAGAALYLNSDGYLARKNMELAGENYEAGNYEEALSYYEEALQYNEAIAEAYLKSAEIYLADQGYDNAIVQLKRGIRRVRNEENEENKENIEVLNAKLADAYLEKADFFLKQGDYCRAAEVLEEGKAETGDKKNILGDRLNTLGDSLETFFVGKSVDEVKVLLLNNGLTPEIEYQESTEYALGIVMKVSGEPETMIRKGGNVLLTVSAGPEDVEVPDVAGMTETEGTAELEKKGFVVNRSEIYDEHIKAGDIITQFPEAGRKVSGGGSVTITISLGKKMEKARVPDLMGKSEEEAMKALEEAGLQLGVVSKVNNENADLTGLVCYQSYSVGSYIDVGTAVDISISLGLAQATYKFTGEISAPTVEEDPNYRSGTLVTVMLIANDGTRLFSTKVTTFPIQQQNITGIKSSAGYILYQYVDAVQSASANDDSVESGEELREIRRPVTFVPE